MLKVNKNLILPLVLMFFVLSCDNVFAKTPMTKRVAVEAGVQIEVMKDLAMPYNPNDFSKLKNRTCLDGRKVADFKNNEVEIIEYWVNLECTYCSLIEPLKAQRNDANMCIVPRHIPSQEFSESLKKALSYEALKYFSINAANLFWEKVLPNTPQNMPIPYEASLMMAFQEAVIDPELFAKVLGDEAVNIVDFDISVGKGNILSTPTFIIQGIRFGSCDFSATELPIVRELAKKARAGDKEAVNVIVKIITNGYMNEQIL